MPSFCLIAAALLHQKSNVKARQNPGTQKRNRRNFNFHVSPLTLTKKKNPEVTPLHQLAFKLVIQMRIPLVCNVCKCTWKDLLDFTRGLILGTRATSPSLKAVAALTNMSIKTVSKVFLKWHCLQKKMEMGHNGAFKHVKSIVTSNRRDTVCR